MPYNGGEFSVCLHEEPVQSLQDSGDPALKFTKKMRVDSSSTAFFSEFRLGNPCAIGTLNGL
jgi:hypothetical protein